METTPLHQRACRPSAETAYRLEATGTPGLAVARLEGGKTREVLCFGSTDAEGKVPVTEATIFQAASLSKQALLYAALKTVEAGQLDLERPLSQYLDDPYEADDPDRGRITARHVLTHTTGWPKMARPACTPRPGSTRCCWRPTWERSCAGGTRTSIAVRSRSTRGSAGR